VHVGVADAQAILCRSRSVHVWNKRTGQPHISNNELSG